MILHCLHSKCYPGFSAVEKYLEEVKNQIMQNGTGASALPTGAHVRDDEQVNTSSQSFAVVRCQKRGYK
jgi:hypothetical protein